MAALKGVESRWDVIRYYSYVPVETKRHIETQHSADSVQCLREVLLYVLSLHPYLGWRVIIDALYWMEEHLFATRIKEYAEPVAGIEANRNDMEIMFHDIDWVLCLRMEPTLYTAQCFHSAENLQYINATILNHQL